MSGRLARGGGCALTALVGFVVAGGCGGGSVEGLFLTPGPVEMSATTSLGGAEVELRYLGVGGWLIRRGEAAILTAPFFSNPGIFRVATWTVRADPDRIDRLLSATLGDGQVDDAAAILVGHAHYDHLMDVPYIARVKAPAAGIYGSETTANTLRAFSDDVNPRRLHAVDGVAGDSRSPGEWIYVADSTARFMALRSNHAPHFAGRNFYAGRWREPPGGHPGIAPEWREGQTYAYLIDLLDGDGRPVFRIHYQDSASEPPGGLVPPLAAGDGRPVDVAIVCPASFDQVRGYPERIMANLRPRHVLLGHWENFFRPLDEELETVPRTDLREFIRRLEGALPPGSTWTLPEPGALLRYR